MRRRTFLAAVFAPFAARAQPAVPRRRVGVLMSLARDDAEVQGWIEAFEDGLRELGWRQGDTLDLDIRWAAGSAERMREHAVALASASPNAVLTNGTPASLAMKAAGRTPIIFVSVADPVRSGLVESLARPGGQITGFTHFEYATAAKWLELLGEIVPAFSHVSVLSNPANSGLAGFLRTIESAARTAGVALTVAAARNAEEIVQALRTIPHGRGAGLIVLPDFTTSLHHETITGLALERRLPAIYPFRLFVSSGGLMAYAVDMRDVYRRAASYADQILRGVPPSELPVQQSTRFQLVINLRTASALGLTLPPALLARADEVIE
jgi:putative tryptophan/tyrosine transport system substrate-binding protein